VQLEQQQLPPQQVPQPPLWQAWWQRLAGGLDKAAEAAGFNSSMEALGVGVVIAVGIKRSLDKRQRKRQRKEWEQQIEEHTSELQSH